VSTSAMVHVTDNSSGSFKQSRESRSHEVQASSFSFRAQVHPRPPAIDSFVTDASDGRYSPSSMSIPSEAYQFEPDVVSPASHSDVHSQSNKSTSHRHKRRRKDTLAPHSMAPVDAESLAVASLRNPEDAVNLLVLASEAAHQMDMASAGGNAEDGEEGRESSAECDFGFQDIPSENAVGITSSQQSSSISHTRAFNHRHDLSQRLPSKPKANLSTFPLVMQGIITPLQVWSLVNLFFTKMHFVFPMIPHHRVPHTEDALARFAEDERDLSLTIVVIASRYMNDRVTHGGDEWKGVHERAWAYLQVGHKSACHFWLSTFVYDSQTRIGDLIRGKPATIGTVEALLLLSGD
jgi:hypothetical protein